MTIPAIELPMEKIIEFCDRWRVTEFASLAPSCATTFALIAILT